jgi:hypothetical protein
MFAPLRRLRRKTTMTGPVGLDAPRDIAWTEKLLEQESLETENRGHHKSVYLVTFPALVHSTTAIQGLKCPSTFTREGIARRLTEAVKHPVYNNPAHASLTRSTEVVAYVVFREFHQLRPGDTKRLAHFHVAVKASSSFRFGPVKLALQKNFGLASHWSTSHDGFWSAVKYGYTPSPNKTTEELDATPYVWQRGPEKASLFELSQEPLTAAALRSRRETKVQVAAEAGKQEPRATELDLYPFIVRHNIRNTADFQYADDLLVQKLKAHGGPALTALAFKLRARLTSLINDVWAWEEVDDRLALVSATRLQRLEQAATEPCLCEGRWRAQAEEALKVNGITPQWFCSDILGSLRDGRREDRPVVVLVGRLGGEGKSFLLAPLRRMFGFDLVQHTPQPGSFPLLGIEKKVVAILDEWTFDTAVVPLSTQLLWFEGKPFPVSRPQNRAEYTGHCLYKGTAPIFVTCKETDLGPLWQQAQAATAAGEASEVTMLLRRLRTYWFTQRVEKPLQLIPECATCFAQMILKHSGQSSLS